jgi:hypothetical protein
VSIPENPNEGFLTEINRPVIISQYAIDIGGQFVLMTDDQSLERQLITFKIGSDQRVVPQASKTRSYPKIFHAFCLFKRLDEAFVPIFFWTSSGFSAQIQPSG